MITLITGLPGACKTLYTLTYVKAWAEKEERQVFYAGINDLMLPWTEIEATKWMDCPPKSIIVIDECQTVFRPRSFGSNVPDYVSKLETHRHQGLDIVLITQHPLLCDSSIRRLAGKHVHCVRKFGMQKSTLHEWPSVRENCDKPAGRTDSIKHHWSFDKKSFKFYKSAEAHTVKRNIPMRVIFLFVILPLIIGFLGYRIFNSFYARTHAKPETVEQQKKQGGSQPVGNVQKAAYLDPIGDARRFTFDRTPRVLGLDLTAPRYDQVTQPKIAPVPSCIQSKTRCKCYTQQATALDVPESMCKKIVERGYFVDWVEPESRQRERSLQALQRDDVPLPLSGESTANVSLSDGYGVLGRRGSGIRQLADSQP